MVKDSVRPSLLNLHHKKKNKKTQTGRRQVLSGAPLRPRLLRPGLQGHCRRCLPGTPRHSGGRAAVQARGLGHGGAGERSLFFSLLSSLLSVFLAIFLSFAPSSVCCSVSYFLFFSLFIFFLLTQERYSSLAPLYYRGAAAAAVVFDVGDRESFAKARHWVGELQRNAGPGIGERERGGGGSVLAILLFSFLEWSGAKLDVASFSSFIFVSLFSLYFFLSSPFSRKYRKSPSHGPRGQ